MIFPAMKEVACLCVLFVVHFATAEEQAQPQHKVGAPRLLTDLISPGADKYNNPYGNPYGNSYNNPYGNQGFYPPYGGSGEMMPPYSQQLLPSPGVDILPPFSGSSMSWTNSYQPSPSYYPDTPPVWVDPKPSLISRIFSLIFSIIGGLFRMPLTVLRDNSYPG